MKNFQEYLLYGTNPDGYLEKTFKPLILNKFVDLINVASTVYLMSKNADFVFYDP